MQQSWHGTGVALITPFKKDLSVDFVALGSVVEHVVSNGLEYLVALGTTSEAATLNEQEREAVVKEILRANAGRVPVLLGMGGNNTSQLLQQIKHQDFTGISAILSVVPYYNKPQQAGLVAHFEAVADASPVPVILYNVPSRTSTNMKAETVLRLAAHKNIVAVKEASGDLMQIMQIIKNKPNGFEVISGDDALTFPMLAVGAKGVISVVANAFPKEFGDMVRQQLAGQSTSAFDLHYRLLDFINLLFADGSPAGIKCALHHMGICGDTLRLPLVNVNHSIEASLKAAVDQITQLR